MAWNRPNLVGHRPDEGRHRANLARTRLVLAKSGRIRPTLARARPNLSRNQPNSQFWPELGQVRLKLVRSRPNFDQNRANSARRQNCPEVGQILPELCHIRPNFALRRPTSPDSTVVAQMSATFGHSGGGPRMSLERSVSTVAFRDRHRTGPRDPPGRQARFCQDGFAMGPQLAAQLWGLFTALWWVTPLSGAIWLAFALCEISRSLEEERRLARVGHAGVARWAGLASDGGWLGVDLCSSFWGSCC